MGPRRVLPALLTVVAATMLAASAVAVASPDASTPDGGDIVELPIAFSVDNTNRTSVRCASDGKPYTIRGTMVAPEAALENPESATLYLHAVTQGEFYWRFKSVPGYDFAHQQAENGNISVTIDRLGYGESDKPPGLDSCFGSQADTADQVVSAMREGDYEVGDGGSPVAFDKVFLAGHSAGGLTATIAAYSFPDNIDGLINFGWADQTTSAFTATEVADTTRRCLDGGDPGTPNYAQFGSDGDRILFHSAEPAVREAVARMTNPDPCGDILSFDEAIVADQVGIPQTTAPVLIVAGENDALFPPPALQLQGARYTGNPDVQVTQLANTGHGFNYEATHLESVALVDEWLSARGG